MGSNNQDAINWKISEGFDVSIYPVQLSTELGTTSGQGY